MIELKQFLLNLFLVFFLVSFSPAPSYADETPFEITNDGRVNINTIFHLAPMETPPANPIEGDLYFNNSRDLLFFSNEKWNKVMFYPNTWVTGNWSACSAECDGGTQTRSVICKRGDGETVPDSYCGIKPMESQVCNTTPCYGCRNIDTGENISLWLTGPSANFSVLCWNSSNPFTEEGRLTTTGKNATSVVFGGFRYRRGEFVQRVGNEYLQWDFYKICREPL